MIIKNFETMPITACGEGKGRQVFTGKNAMLVANRLEKDAFIPLHSHPHEQITVMIKGSCVATLGEEKTVVKPGDMILVEPNKQHGMLALEDGTEFVDVFSPIREDFLA